MKTPLERITAVMKYYYKQGVNKESVNKIYKKLLYEKFRQPTEN
jgi:hypothetical protein